MLLESSLRGRCLIIMTVSNCDLITFIRFDYVIRISTAYLSMWTITIHIDIYRNT